MTTLLADYHEEQSLFRGLLADDCQRRILFFRAESGKGKTALVEFCLHHYPCPRNMSNVVIDLKGGTVNLAHIFYTLGREIGWERLPRFTQHLNSLDLPPSVQIDRNLMAGIGNRINVVLQTGDRDTRQYRLAALTEAFFTDLQALPQAVLMVLDTYEQASTEVEEWIETSLLDWAGRLNQLRILIAGQEVPEPKLAWRRYCQILDLPGVREPQHWLPVVQNLRPHLAEDLVLFLLDTVCRANQGRPDAIIKVIRALPQ